MKPGLDRPPLPSPAVFGSQHPLSAQGSGQSTFPCTFCLYPIFRGGDRPRSGPSGYCTLPVPGALPAPPLASVDGNVPVSCQGPEATLGYHGSSGLRQGKGPSWSGCLTSCGPCAKGMVVCVEPHHLPPTAYGHQVLSLALPSPTCSVPPGMDTAIAVVCCSSGVPLFPATVRWEQTAGSYVRG